MRASRNLLIHLAPLVFIAGVLPGLSCFGQSTAQDQDTAQSQSGSDAPPATKKSDVDQAAAASAGKKPKKVWTNENMGDVSASPVSQVGQGGGNSSEPALRTPVSAKAPSAQLIATYRKQLNALHAQQASVEKQIAELKDFKRGEPGHDVGLQLHKRYSTEPIDDQIRKLEAKRKQLADQIDALSTSAQHKGVDLGQLP